MNKHFLYALLILVCSFLVSAILFNGSSGPNSPYVRFGDLLIFPVFAVIVFDPIQFLWKKYVSMKELNPIFSIQSALGILENYFVYWIIFSVLRIAYWIYFDIPHTYEDHLPYWRQ